MNFVINSRLSKEDILSPKWEPDDCSILNLSKINQRIAGETDDVNYCWCHYSSRIIFTCDKNSEISQKFLNLVNLVVLEQVFDCAGSSSSFGRKLSSYKESLREIEDVVFDVLYPDGTSSIVPIKDILSSEDSSTNFFS